MYELIAKVAEEKRKLACSKGEVYHHDTPFIHPSQMNLRLSYKRKYDLLSDIAAIVDYKIKNILGSKINAVRFLIETVRI